MSLQKKLLEGIIESEGRVLSADDDFVDSKIWSLERLEKLGQKETATAVHEALSSVYWLVRYNAYQLLGKLENEKSIPILIQRIEEEEDETLEAIVDALGVFPLNGQIEDAFIRVIREELGFSASEKAAKHLLKGGSSKLMPLLLEQLESEKQYTRELAICCLGIIAQKETFPILDNYLLRNRDDDWEGYSSALSGLGHFGEELAFPVLQREWEYLKEEDWEDAETDLVRSLVALKTPKVLPILHEMASSSKSHYARKDAVDAIASYGEKLSIPVLERMLDEPNHHTRLRVWKALYDLGAKSGEEWKAYVLEALKRSDTETTEVICRMDAAMFAGQGLFREAIPTLVELLEHESAGLRSRAVRALGDLEYLEVREKIQKMISSQGNASQDFYEVNQKLWELSRGITAATEEELFAKLREILASEPSGENWTQLLRLFRLCDKGIDKTLAIEYAKEHLKGWPTHICSMEVPTRGYEEPLWPLVKQCSTSAILSDLQWFLFTGGDFSDIEVLSITTAHWDDGHEAAAFLRLLADAPSIHNLKELDLSSSGLWRADQIDFLAELPSLKRLERLYLTTDYAGEYEAQIVAESPVWNQLKSLSLGGDSFDDDALVRLAHSENLVFLESLDVRGGSMTTKGFEHLAYSPHIKSLTSLLIYSSALDDSCLSILAQSEQLSYLKELSLGKGMLTSEGLEALGHSPFLNELEKLSLWKCEIQDEDALRLLHYPALSNLQTLELPTNPVSEDVKQQIRAVLEARKNEQS